MKETLEQRAQLLVRKHMELPNYQPGYSETVEEYARLIIAFAEQEARPLVEALEWYAQDHSSWNRFEGEGPAYHEPGVARKALAKYKEQTK